jgi:hypothetical protein
MKDLREERQELTNDNIYNIDDVTLISSFCGNHRR